MPVKALWSHLPQGEAEVVPWQGAPGQRRGETLTPGCWVTSACCWLSGASPPLYNGASPDSRRLGRKWLSFCRAGSPLPCPVTPTTPAVGQPEPAGVWLSTPSRQRPHGLPRCSWLPRA